ncbi:MAG: PDZ domain-containing protein [Bacteroidetes bacterium]|nr:PDZ domain-containing protein [Bacteroidota bacterium]
MKKIISLFMAGCLVVTAANAQEEKKVVIVKRMDTTIVHGKADGPEKMTVTVENGKITVNGKTIEGVNLPEMMGGANGMPKVMMFKSDDANGSIAKLDGKVSEIKIRKGMPLDMSKMGESFDFTMNDGPKLGISIEDVSEGTGAKVVEVTEGSAAAKAGITKNDVITAVDGAAINDVSALQEKAAQLKAGDAINIKLTREGKTKEVNVKIPKKIKKANI